MENEKEVLRRDRERLIRRIAEKEEQIERLQEEKERLQEENNRIRSGLERWWNEHSSL